MITLNVPFSREDVLKLKVGDIALINGTIFTARDKAHKYLIENNFDRIKNSVIYHCGPITKDNVIIAAGPTTSARMNIYTPKLIRKYDIRAIVGKGGMDKSVLNALRGRAVYFSAIGGAAILYAKSIKLKNVHKSDFGMAEAIYELEVKNFPAIVTMDAKGNSLHDDVLRDSKSVFLKLID